MVIAKSRTFGDLPLRANGSIQAARFRFMKRNMCAEEMDIPKEITDPTPNQGDLILSGSYGQRLSFGSYDE